MSEPMKPMEIEQRSFEIITELLGDRVLDPENELVIKRVIHTTADFDYCQFHRIIMPFPFRLCRQEVLPDPES